MKIKQKVELVEGNMNQLHGFVSDLTKKGMIIDNVIVLGKTNWMIIFHQQEK